MFKMRDMPTKESEEEALQNIQNTISWFMQRMLSSEDEKERIVLQNDILDQVRMFEELNKIKKSKRLKVSKFKKMNKAWF